MPQHVEEWLLTIAICIFSCNSTAAQIFMREGHYPGAFMESTASMDTLKQVHKPLCHSVQKEVELRDEEFEYMPSSYTEYICANPLEEKNVITRDSPMCRLPGFECIQQKKDMVVAKRKRGSENWEFFTQKVASHCECMLPSFELSSGGTIASMKE